MAEHGDKYLNGKGGTDTYVYISAGGNDVMEDDSGTLVMQDIASTGVTLSRSGGSDDIELRVTSTGKTVTLKGEASQWNSGLSVTFSDGVSWSRDQIRDAATPFTWVGSTSNATLTGNAYGTNVFQFGSGHEVANGGQGVISTGRPPARAGCNQSSERNGLQKRARFRGGSAAINFGSSVQATICSSTFLARAPASRSTDGSPVQERSCRRSQPAG